MHRVLLTSVFKPFGVDGVYSRRDSKIELFHNQITKYQGCFSIRANSMTFGLHAMAMNINAQTVVLDYPTLGRFRREVAKSYDYVGIGSIVGNFQKVKKMVQVVREVSPKSKVVIGGFCSMIPGIRDILGVDHVCVGDGISFMRELLGQPPEFTFRHPDVYSITRQVMGVPILWRDYRIHIIVGLGCSYGCDFCTPSHMFGQKHIRLLKSGEDIYREMVRLEKKFNDDTFTFIGDDNFLLDRQRAVELRDLIIKNEKTYKIFMFASADLLMEWDPAELAEMGVNFIWIGRESKFGSYKKNENIDYKTLTDELQQYGIKIIMSSILLVDNHNKANVWEDINEHLDSRPAYSQFSFYSPFPGTPLWNRMEKEHRLIKGIAFEEMHAFKQPWFVHPHFTLEEAENLQTEAYLRDFHELGPGLVRHIEVDFEGYMLFKNSTRKTLRKRSEITAPDMPRNRAILLASEWLVPKPDMRKPIRELRERIEAEFGKTTALEKAMAMGLFAFGKKQDLVMKYLGDDIQPRTRVTRYAPDS